MDSYKRPARIVTRLFTLALVQLVLACLIPRKDHPEEAPAGAGSTCYRVSGLVRDPNGPVERAVVRLQATELKTETDSHGTFALEIPWSAREAFITAWAEGYYIAGVKVEPREARGIVIELTAHAARDNPDYVWLLPGFRSGQAEDQGCAECHSSAGTNLGFSLPVDEWAEDAHGRSATNPFF